MNNSISKLPAVRTDLLDEIAGLFGEGQMAAVRCEIHRCRRVALLRDRTVYPRTAGYAKREKATVKEN